MLRICRQICSDVRGEDGDGVVGHSAGAERSCEERSVTLWEFVRIVSSEVADGSSLSHRSDQNSAIHKFRDKRRQHIPECILT